MAMRLRRETTLSIKGNAAQVHLAHQRVQTRTRTNGCLSACTKIRHMLGWEFRKGNELFYELPRFAFSSRNADWPRSKCSDYFSIARLVVSYWCAVMVTLLLVLRAHG